MVTACVVSYYSWRYLCLHLMLIVYLMLCSGVHLLGDLCIGELQQSQIAQKQDPLLKCGVYSE